MQEIAERKKQVRTHQKFALLFLFLSLISFALLFLLPANIPEKSACLTGTACIYKDGNRVTCFTSHLCR